MTGCLTWALRSAASAPKGDPSEADEDDDSETQDDAGKADATSLTLQKFPTSPFKLH